jgi:wyosine [tRNA(Phe)-imidazoG37] synthetase (radical SAM superfamily)
MIVFGPIPSRRLGKSLGINNVPPKICSYSCVYCQLGNTDYMSLKRREFFSPEKIFDEAAEKVYQLKRKGETIDYITFVPDGEPTIDINLGKIIEKLKKLEIKTAVISNASLIWIEAVQNDLQQADWVSLKIDSASEKVWKKINRPHGILKLEKIIHGIEEFASYFKGELATETMLVKDLNDNLDSVIKTAELIKYINPEKAYLLVPTKPPAENWVKIPDEYELNSAYQVFRDLNIDTELLIQNEGREFTYDSNVENELLGILAVHPMRKDAIDEFIKKANANNSLILSLIESNTIREVQYNNNTFFLKNLRK